VQVVRREGLSRGFGFVTFKDEISVEKCLLVNHFIKGRKVELKRAVPKVRLGSRVELHFMGWSCVS
jgi:RNA recognition motif-containing protein